jgi:hypothetical protein
MAMRERRRNLPLRTRIAVSSPLMVPPGTLIEEFWPTDDPVVTLARGSVRQ